MFKSIANWWKNASWRKPLWRGVRDVRDDVIDFMEDALEEITPIMAEIAMAGGKKFLAEVYAAVQMYEQPDVTSTEKHEAARKHILRKFRDSRDNITDRALDAAISMMKAKLRQALGENT